MARFLEDDDSTLLWRNAERITRWSGKKFTIPQVVPFNGTAESLLTTFGYLKLAPSDNLTLIHGDNEERTVLPSHPWWCFDSARGQHYDFRFHYELRLKREIRLMHFSSIKESASFLWKHIEVDNLGQDYYQVMKLKEIGIEGIIDLSAQSEIIIFDPFECLEITSVEQEPPPIQAHSITYDLDEVVDQFGFAIPASGRLTRAARTDNRRRFFEMIYQQ